MFTIIYNTAAQILAKVITASTTLIITVIIARSLGPHGFGEFTKIFIFIGYFYTIADFGLNAIYVKLTSGGKGAVGLLRALIGLRLIMAGLLLLVAGIIAFYLPYNAQNATGFSPLVKTGIVIASLTLLTQALFTTANAHFQKILRYDLSSIAAVGSSLVILVSTLVVFASGGSLLAYVFSYVWGGLSLVFVAYFLLFRNLGQLVFPRFNREQFYKLLSQSWPVGLALIFNLVYFRIDVLILSYSRSTFEVGLYGLAYLIFEATLSIPIFFANSLYPHLTRLYLLKGDAFNRQVRLWFKLLTLIGSSLAIVLALGAYLIPLFWGKQFVPSTVPLQILAVGIPVFFISALFWHVLIIYNRQKYLIGIYAAGAAFNLLANLIFIPIYGYLAAATTTVVSEIIVMLLLLLATRK